MWLQVEMKFRLKVVSRLMTYQPVSLENQFTQGKFAPVEVQLIFSLCGSDCKCGSTALSNGNWKKNLKNRCGYHEEGDIGGYPKPQYRSNKWQIPKYCMENRPNTNTKYFNHIYNWFHILMAASI